MDLRFLPLEPVDWSRSQGSLEEENIENFSTPIFIKAKKFQGLKKVKTLMVGTKNSGSIFLDTVFNEKKRELFGTIILPENQIKEKELEKESIEDETCYLYHINDDDLIILNIQYLIKPERCFDFVQVLFQNLQVENILIFDDITESEYKIDFEYYFPHLRVLQTKKSKNEWHIEHLETPNIVSNISAEIMEYCQIYSISASLFISISSNRGVELETIIGFENVLKELDGFDSLKKLKYNLKLKNQDDLFL
eukprot:gene6061-10062_t